MLLVRAAEKREKKLLRRRRRVSLFFFSRLTFADPKRISSTFHDNNNDNNSPRSSTSALWVSMRSPRESTSRCVVVVLISFPFSTFFSLSLLSPLASHFFCLGPFFSLPSPKTKKTAHSRLCDACGGTFFVSRALEREKECTKTEA